MTEKERELKLEIIQMAKKVLLVAHELSQHPNMLKHSRDLMDICDKAADKALDGIE